MRRSHSMAGSGKVDEEKDSKADLLWRYLRRVAESREVWRVESSDLLGATAIRFCRGSASRLLKVLDGARIAPLTPLLRPFWPCSASPRTVFCSNGLLLTTPTGLVITLTLYLSPLCSRCCDCSVRPRRSTCCR